MSTAVSHFHHSMEDVHSKNLPSLAQIMPMNSIGNSANNTTNNGSISGVTGSNSVNTNNAPLSPTLLLMAPTFDQKMYQPVSSPEIFSNNSSASTTPASSFSSQGSGTSIIEEKCTCKSSPNKIPRPRNAFILFRQKYHQAVLDEGGVIRTNPEVSRELGRRWRALPPDEKDHWNNLAEEEKKNHARKYPGYRYAPRRNGKNKGCPACRQKALRQQQLQLHNQQMLQMQQDQYQQYFQQTQPQAAQPQQIQAHQQVPQPQQQQQNPQAQQANSQPFTQFVLSNPYQQFTTSQYNTDLAQHEKLSPLSVMPGQLNQDYMGNQQFIVNYDVGHIQGAAPPISAPMPGPAQLAQMQRYGSLPTPVSATNYGFDVFNMPSQQ
ncbi:uncharacterized protein PRCAT00002217001 [Priceomyces carsonii]|uniref:uncharacterized protein n=1 Tax=Priceomyces carsonii TaxID=28549 RepID=UPI002EDAB22C|nr:unnamed protein product [Priceomyces carsonii]